MCPGSEKCGGKHPKPHEKCGRKELKPHEKCGDFLRFIDGSGIFTPFHHRKLFCLFLLPFLWGL
jgi:hypothetical protein